MLAIDAFAPPHEMGSSHGLTRIIRLAYHEDPSYVPLLRRAYALWFELERQAGQKLLHITGSLEIGLPGGEIFEDALASCRNHDLPHEMLTRPKISHASPPTDCRITSPVSCSRTAASWTRRAASRPT